jgi:hypothetical protein
LDAERARKRSLEENALLALLIAGVRQLSDHLGKRVERLAELIDTD